MTGRLETRKPSAISDLRVGCLGFFLTMAIPIQNLAQIEERQK
jgi:hypothetical protein